jgi:hypothetical protein
MNGIVTFSWNRQQLHLHSQLSYSLRSRKMVSESWPQWASFLCPTSPGLSYLLCPYSFLTLWSLGGVLSSIMWRMRSSRCVQVNFYQSAQRHTPEHCTARISNLTFSSSSHGWWQMENKFISGSLVSAASFVEILQWFRQTHFLFFLISPPPFRDESTNVRMWCCLVRALDTPGGSDTWELWWNHD